MVIFIHRPDFIGLSENPEDKEVTQIIIAKHRNGETGEIPMLFKSEQVRFVEMDEALAAQAMHIPSGMNSAPQEPAGYDPFAQDTSFPGGFGNSAF